jgi:hypothetical protein
MKAIVEWGIPSLDCRKPESMPAGCSGQHICNSPKDASMLAAHLAYTMSQGEIASSSKGFLVNKTNPRVTLWGDGFWIAVSAIDGIPRGPFAGTVNI